MARFLGLRHLHLKVADVERAGRFYERGFGMRRFAVKQDGKLVALVSPGLRDQLTLSEGARGGEVDPEAPARIGEQGGIDHFGFLLSPGSDLDGAIARLVELGAKYVKHHDIGAGARTAFLRDPDGYLFQLVRFPRGTKAYVALLPVLRWLGLSAA